MLILPLPGFIFLASICIGYRNGPEEYVSKNLTKLPFFYLLQKSLIIYIVFEDILWYTNIRFEIK